MEKMYCPICENEILITYNVPPRTFKINSSGKIIIDDNNKAFVTVPYFQFICSYDPNHEIEQKDLFKWMDKVEYEIRNSNILND